MLLWQSPVNIIFFLHLCYQHHYIVVLWWFGITSLSINVEEFCYFVQFVCVCSFYHVIEYPFPIILFFMHGQQVLFTETSTMNNGHNMHILMQSLHEIFRTVCSTTLLLQQYWSLCDYEVYVLKFVWLYCMVCAFWTMLNSTRHTQMNYWKQHTITKM